MAETEREALRQGFPFKVNGVQVESERQKLLARDILELAREKDAIPGKPDDYTLHGDKGEYRPDAWVDLEQDNVFITVPNTPTRVAKGQRNIRQH